MTTILHTRDAAQQQDSVAVPVPVRQRRKPNTALYISALPLAVVLAWVLAPTLFASADPLQGIATEKFLAPSFEHWFGTDHLGRDVYTRVVHGAAKTFLTAGLAVAIGFLVGTTIGTAAGTLGSATDSVLMRLIDVLLAIPGFLIALIVVTMSEPGPLSLGIGVGIAAIASFARVSRAEILRVHNLDYIEAAFLNGGTYFSVLRRHLIPNASGPVLALIAIDLGAAILTISSLGFLGFGAPPPEPEWGVLIAEGRQYLGTAWWLTFLPGAVIVTTVAALGVLSREVLKLLRF